MPHTGVREGQARVLAHGLTESGDLLGSDRHEHRISLLQAFGHEGDQGGEELVEVRVQKGRMCEASVLGLLSPW